MGSFAGRSIAYQAWRLAVLGLFASLDPSSDARATANDITQVPISWCGLEGSPATEMPPPAVTGETNLNGVLWRRHERATDNTWADQARIIFRSALMAPFGVPPGVDPEIDFPVISDTKTDVGDIGDVLVPKICHVTKNKCDDDGDCTGGGGDVCEPTDELIDVWNRCHAAWKSLADERVMACRNAMGTDCDRFNAQNSLGIIAVNIRKWVDGNGDSVLFLGRGGTGGDPPFPHLMITDPTQYVFQQSPEIPGCNFAPPGTDCLPVTDPLEIILAHEIGHVLGLDHLRDNSPPTNLMATGLHQDTDGDGKLDGNDLVTSVVEDDGTNVDQRHVSRDRARMMPASLEDPPAVLVPGPLRRTTIVDALGDVLRLDARFVDIARHAVTYNDDDGTLSFSHLLGGLIEEADDPLGLSYWTLVDVDSDATTGGGNDELATLGVPISLCTRAGIDLVTRFFFIDTEFGPEPQAKLFRFVTASGAFDTGTFVSATKSALEVYEDAGRLALFDILTASFDGGAFGVASPFRTSAVSEFKPSQGLTVAAESATSAANASETVVDFVPENCALADAVLAVPTFPVCGVTPDPADPGDRVTGEATGLLADRMAKVFLGDERVAMGTINSDGTAFLDFSIPITARPGTRLVTVGVAGTALTADCSLDVGEGPPLILTPQASVNEPGQDHTVIAVFRDEAGDPVAAVPVRFSVDSGPNAGAPGACTFNADCTTDAEGMVFFTYTGAGGPGVDQLTAALQPDGEELVTSNVALKFWDTDCNQNDVADTCDVDCAGFDGACETGYVGFCGLSADENGDGVPDECNRPPDCSNAGAEPDELWPPYHQEKDVVVAGVTDEDGDPIAITVDSIFQDEPVSDGGSGHTSPDADGVGSGVARLRSERAGSGDGRVYHVSFTAEDGRGGTCTGEVTVCVPHDPRPGHICVDQGPLYDSTAADGARMPIDPDAVGHGSEAAASRACGSGGELVLLLAPWFWWKRGRRRG